jgi:hypothetical protein
MRRQLLIPVLVFALAVGFASPARATTPTVGSDSFVNTVTSITVTKTPDGNAFVSATFTGTLTGFVAASCSGALTEVVHPDGSANFKGSETCTGTVAGQCGPFSIAFVATGAPDGSFQGQDFFSGAGTLENLRGTSIFQGHSITPTSTAGTATDQVHFN